MKKVMITDFVKVSCMCGKITCSCGYKQDKPHTDNGYIPCPQCGRRVKIEK